MPSESLKDISDLMSQTTRRNYSAPCPFLDGKVFHFQSMTAAEVLEVMNTGGAAGDILAIQYSLVDDEGRRLLSGTQAKQLADVDGRIVAWCSHQITQHNLVMPVDTMIEDAEGN